MKGAAETKGGAGKGQDGAQGRATGSRPAPLGCPAYPAPLHTPGHPELHPGGSLLSVCLSVSGEERVPKAMYPFPGGTEGTVTRPHPGERDLQTPTVQEAES